MLPADLIAKLNECAANDFVGPRDQAFVWLTRFTSFVVAGLVFEIFELYFELKATAQNWIPSLKYRIVWYPKRIHLAKVAASVGWVLIVIGVAGERYQEANVKDFDVKIQECSDAKVAKATLEAGDAAQSAKTAREESTAAKIEAAAAKLSSGDALTRAHAAERSLAKAEDDAGKAQTAAASALTTATDASARAGKAEVSLEKAETEAKNAETSSLNALTLAREARQEAASFESDLKRLKQQAADRELNGDQQERVRERIAQFLGTPYELAVTDTPEAVKLLGEIDAAVGSAGWLYKPSENKAFRFAKPLRSGHDAELLTLSGIGIGLSAALFVKLKPAADALAKALNSQGISAMVVKLPDNDPSPNSVHIMVGSKP
jgi:cell wall-associated NlpC family hydrolase